MGPGAWVLVAAVVVAVGVGAWRAASDGRFRGTHRVRLGDPGPGDVPTGAERRPEPSGDRGVLPGTPLEALSVLAGTTYDGERGARATLLQFSSAFCAPCRATRRTLADVAGAVPGVSHVEVDAESHLDLVRRLGILRTPTTLVLDGEGREVTRASGAPRAGQVLAALEGTA
jgi:thiol-disulfide isomerase/thioredoxin